MELDVLKIYAGSFISELDIDLEDKLTLIEFLKEADEYDIMAVLTEGELPDEWTEDHLAALDEELELLGETLEGYEEELLLNELEAWEKTKRAARSVGSAVKGAPEKARQVKRKVKTGWMMGGDKSADVATGGYGKIASGVAKARRGASQNKGKLALGGAAAAGLTAAALYRRRKRKKAQQMAQQAGK